MGILIRVITRARRVDWLDGLPLSSDAMVLFLR